MNSHMNWLAWVLLISLVISNALTYSRLRQLECDAGESVYVERDYTYPIFRSQGYDPDDYAIGVRNPLTTSKRYWHCSK